MDEMSDYLKNKLLNLTLNGTAFAGMNNPYVSLNTADPTPAGDLSTEVSATGTSYVRMPASFIVATGTSGLVDTDADTTFPAATAAWGTVSYIGLWDASIGGNMLYYTALDAAKVIDIGDVFKIAADNLTVELS